MRFQADHHDFVVKPDHDNLNRIRVRISCRYYRRSTVYLSLTPEQTSKLIIALDAARVNSPRGRKLHEAAKTALFYPDGDAA